MADWSQEDAAAADREGWNIFLTAGAYGHDEYELERTDDPVADGGEPKFANDSDAWLHVRTQASAGSALHQRALAFLEAEAPDEYRQIMEWGAP